MSDKHGTETEGMRLDKWLWCARFFKTRKLAADAIASGRVREDGRRIKPARSIRPGDCITVRKGPFSYTVTIRDTVRSRLSAPEAENLYVEHEDSKEARHALSLQLKSAGARTPRPDHRPDKAP